MTSPIKVLHFADLHIGMENYGRVDPSTGLNRRVVDFLDRLDEVVAYAVEHEADLVLFAGDAFRTRNPSPTHQREFAQRIRQLSETGIPTVLLVGNHDVPVMAQRASSIEIFSTLAVPNVTVVERPGLHRIETRQGMVQVVAIPYPVRQRLLSREEFRRMTQEELDTAVSEIVIGILEELAAQVDPTQPAILMGHFSVAGAHWGSERNIMVGRDVTVPVSALLGSQWDYVALGHIHQHQNLNPDNNPPVVYPGSLERVDFGEERQPKGFCWVKLNGGKQADWQYIESPARKFITIRADVRQSNDPLKAISAAVAKESLQDCVVRLVVNMTPEQEPGLRDADISPLLHAAFFAQVNREVDRAARDRLEGLEPDAMTPKHLLERYLLSIGKPEEDLEPYLEAAEVIFAEDREEGA